MKSGRLWVAGMLGLGAAAGLFSVIFWTRPENAVGGAFTQLHAAFVRGPREKAFHFVADPVTVSGRAMSRKEFVETYKPPPRSGSIEVEPCPAAPDHQGVRMNDQVYCFLKEGHSWRLHWVGTGVCRCR